MARLFFILSLFLTVLVQPAPILAQATYSIKEMTPDVEKALENRRARYSELEALKADGTVGENNRGYVKLLTGSAQAKDIVDAENADRKQIYQTIADQNNLSDQIETIETVFAQVQREKADPGHMIQREDEEWVKKQ